MIQVVQAIPERAHAAALFGFAILLGIILRRR